MAGSNPKYYWDTCLFLAWLKDESSRKPGEMDGVREYLTRHSNRQISLMTSVLTLTEMTIAKVPAGTENLLEQVMQRRNFTRLSIDLRVATLARDLRNHYIADPKKYHDMGLTVPDSLHLASAILNKATEFHTFDEFDKPKYKALGLIPLSGNVAGHKLVICKPIAKQLGIVYGK